MMIYCHQNAFQALSDDFQKVPFRTVIYIIVE